MAQYFFDTSALVKRYHREDGSERVEAIFAESRRIVRISALGIVETHSALAVKARAGVLKWETVLTLSGFVYQDLSRGVVKPHGITPQHFSEAEELVLRFGREHRLRSLDAIQLAVAVGLRNSGRVDSLVTADVTLQEVARLLGFAVVNPQDR